MSTTILSRSHFVSGSPQVQSHGPLMQVRVSIHADSCQAQDNSTTDHARLLYLEYTGVVIASENLDRSDTAQLCYCQVLDRAKIR
jgi:hypothetical protein